MKNKNAKGLLVAALISMMMAPYLAPVPAHAQPADNPPAGNIDARFNTVKAVGSGGITVGEDLSTNVAGFIKLISAGANSYYTTFTAGTQSGNVAYTLPPALPGVDSYLKSNTSGVLTWSTASISQSLQQVTTVGATTTDSVTLDSDGNGTTTIGGTAAVKGAAGVVLGEDLATNVAGVIKMFSAGANAFYTTFTTGTQTGNVNYTLPLALPGRPALLASGTGGVMSWDESAYITDGNSNWDNSYGFITTAGETDPLAVLKATFTAAGDLLVGSGSGTYAKLTKGSANQVLKMDGAGTNVGWAADATGITSEADTLDTVTTRSAATANNVTVGDSLTVGDGSGDPLLTFNGTGATDGTIAWDATNSEMLVANGEVGIGVADPTNKLHVNSGAAETAIRGEYDANTFGYIGANGYGVVGQSTGNGVYGNSTATTGAITGVSGQTASTSGYGVYGNASTATGNTIGVWGRAVSATGRGVYGSVTDTSGTNYGVYGTSPSSAGYGGYFSNSSTGTGLYVTSTSGYAAVFNAGNVGIGNVAPTQKLHVTGNMRLTGALYDGTGGSGDPGTSGQILSSTATGTDWIDAPSAGANTTLSNLGTVAANTSLVSDTDNTDDLGSSSIGWKDVYSRTVKLDGATSGTTTLQPSATAGSTTITLPAETGTVCTTGSVCSGYQASGSYLTSEADTLGTVTGRGATAATGIEVARNPTAGEIHYKASSTDGPWLGITTDNVASAYNAMVASTDSSFIFTNGTIEQGGLVIGPWSASSKGIKIDGTNGNVGIGTAGPGSPLHIYKDQSRSALTGATKGLLHLWAGDDFAANDVAAITFGGGNNGDTPRGIIGMQLESTGGNLFFGTSNDWTQVTNTAMLIDHLGQVGIGTTTPSYPLHVVGTMYASTNVAAGNSFWFPNSSLLMFASAATGDTGNAYTFADDAGTDYKQIKAGSIRITDTSSSSLLSSLNADGTAYVSGNVGVGITTAATALHVAPSSGVTIGEDKAGGSANTVGTMKMISAGDNAFYSTITAGTQTANANYTLPTAPPSGGDKYLKSTTGGAMSWADASVTETDPTWSNGGNQTNAITRTGTETITTTGKSITGNTSGTGATNYGVRGNATGTSGTTYGVQGTNASDTGYGGYFTNTNATSGTALYAASTAGYAAIFNVGNVGIGTTTPATSLQVAGDTGLTLGLDYPSGMGNVPGKVIFVSYGDSAAHSSFTAGAQGANNADYTLPTALPAGGDKFLKSTTGGVMSWADASVTETDPLAVLKATFTTAGDLLLGTGAGTYARLGKGTANQVLKMDGAGTNVGWAADAGITSESDPYNVWATNGADIYNINDDQVGIGVTAPTRKLEVSSAAASTAVHGEYSSTIYGELGTANYGAYGLNGASVQGYLASSSIGAYGTNGTNYGYLGSSAYGAYGNGATGVYGTSASSGGYGVYGNATATSGVNHGVYGTTAGGAGSAGVYGTATGTGGTTYGVEGYVAGTGAPLSGVYGLHGTGNYGHLGTSSAGADGYYNGGANYGQLGTANYGVNGVSSASTGIGVYGNSSATGAGTSYGVYGKSSTASGAGVYGITDNAIGKGVQGAATETNGINWGVYGVSDSIRGTGVYGLATTASGGTSGVAGESASAAGKGVYGLASSTSPTNTYGVYGSAVATSGSATGVGGASASTGGIGVYGETSATTGTNYAVKGVSHSTAGYGVHGSNDAVSNTTYGVYGSVASSSGYAVRGYNTGGNTNGFLGGGTMGVQGTDTDSGSWGALGTSSYGAYGNGIANSTTSISGVTANATNSTGTGQVTGVSVSATGNTGATYGIYVSSTNTDGDAYGIYQTTSPQNFFRGNVGIGALTASTPTYALDVQDAAGSSNYVARFLNTTNVTNGFGVMIGAGTNASAVDRLINFTDYLGTTINGYIYSNSGVVTLVGFAGSHEGSISDEKNSAGYEPGTIMTVKKTTNHPDSSGKADYYLEPSSEPYAKDIFGVYGSKNMEEENLHVITALGEGYVLVTSENGLIKRGDPITSSSSEGLGMKAMEAGTILGIATQDWDPATVTEEVTLPDGRVVKKGKVAVYFYPGFPYAGDTKVLKRMVEEQQKKLAEQQKKLDDLQSQMDEMKALVKTGVPVQSSGNDEVTILEGSVGGESNLLTYLYTFIGKNS